MHGLHAGRIVNMGYRWDLGPSHVQLVDTEQLLLVVAHLAAAVAFHIGNQKHVGTWAIEFKIILYVLGENGRSEWAELSRCLIAKVERSSLLECPLLVTKQTNWL